MSLLDTKEGREAVRWALDHLARFGTPRHSTEQPPTQVHDDAFVAILDPSKLAEMIAVEARRCGLDVGGSPPADRQPYNVFHGVDLVGCVDWSRSNKSTYSSAFASGAATMWSMPQARTILAALIALPDGAKDEAEKILRGEHG
jgi:hypothetical protein